MTVQAPPAATPLLDAAPAAVTPTSASVSDFGKRFPGLAPLSSHAYRFLFVGTALTMTGNFMQMVAQGWLIYDLTDSPTWLGIVSFARGIPMLVLALFAGVLVDRFDRRRLLVTAQGLTALVAVVLAALIFTDAVQPWHVALAAFLGGSFFVIIIPCRQALVSATIERSQLGVAIGLMSTAQNSGRVLGPALAGVLIALIGAAMSFAVQALGFVLALACSTMLGPQPPRAGARSISPLQALLEGLRYVWDDSTVLALISIQAIPAFLIMPYNQLLPIFARDILHTGPDGLGTLMAANGIGSVLGAVIIVLLPFRRQGIFLFVSLASFGLLLPAFAASTWLPLSTLIMGLLGTAQAIYLASNTTLVQLAAPDELRGRVQSVFMMTFGLMSLGSLPQGFLADWFGAPAVVSGSGLLAFLVVIVYAIRNPAIRRL
ncbi:MAG: MFS transporter [Chloroflexi bacterium]|nr:MFS transporter [Chloroflexota bacterium]